jgi:hypothetical protein
VPTSNPPARRPRILAALVSVLLVTTACIGGDGPDGFRAPGTPLPDVARVTCTRAGTESQTREVLPQADGVHVLIERRGSGDSYYYVRAATARSLNQGGRLQGPLSEIRTTMPPGDILVGCFEPGQPPPWRKTAGVGYARLTVLDPDDLWFPPELSCDEHGLEKIDARGPGHRSLSLEELARRLLSGLEPEDTFENPGYPETQWHLASLLITRGEEAIARIEFDAYDSPRWALLRPCRGSGIDRA